MANDGGMNWGDIVEDDGEFEEQVDQFVLPPDKEVKGNDGTRTVTRYERTEEGVIFKKITKTRMNSRRVVTSKAARERKNKMTKFGDCQGRSRGPEKGITSICYDPVSFDWEGEAQTVAVEEGNHRTEDVARLEKQLLMLNRPKGQAHSKLAQWNRKREGGEAEAGRPGIGGRPGGSYVPPSRRLGARRDDDEDEYTLVITNLPEETTRDDVKILLSHCRNGRMSVRARGVWGFEKETNKVRFYRRIGDKYVEGHCCFCAFPRKSDAEAVIKTLDKHRYGGLVLGCEFTKSRSQMDKERNRAGLGSSRPTPLMEKMAKSKKQYIPGM